MFRKLLLLFLFPLVLAACGRQGREKGYSTDPGTDSSITFDISSDSASGQAFMFPDTVTILMDSAGRVGWLRGNIRPARLQQEVQDSLMSIYVHTGKLPSRLQMQYLGTVTMGIRGEADDMIRRAQVVLRNVIAVKTLNRPYGRLDSATQAGFRKQYPALFQKYY